ncbi:rhodanese-like domain-containing protein [Croceibacterium sp. LX-88]|uniref:Rhodanese-like domain-containing protein n=1 Tax=Croceibacterium selenioxidans TaxID=2838833 RepID=A0ABS5WB78_9SPHN|nr:rhodanese-like domain-containing protein [Croceibacterium selenioxidans]MBT2135714.1 rhodanese-like domain-containing protein [Croceibacterium selenioxidans]
MRPIRSIVVASALAASLLALPLHAQAPIPANPQVDYEGFVELAGRLGAYREGRRIGWEEFARGARDGGAILLDARSESAFAAGHLAGAINLPLPDFTAERLAQVLGPDADRPVYIYCNNNFADDRPPVAVKKVELALNIPTFINLVGYGYENVWELADVIRTDGPGVSWVSNAP